MFGDVVLGRPPSPASPGGTLFALAFGKSTELLELVELDIATGATLTTRTLEPIAGSGAVALLSRTSDRLHVAEMTHDGLVWTTYTTELESVAKRRLAGVGPVPAGDGRSDARHQVDAFLAIDDEAVVVMHSALALVFNGRGERVAAHDCAPLGFVGFARVRLDVGDGLVLVSYLNAKDLKPAVCAFGVDPRAKTAKAVFDSYQEISAIDGHLYRYAVGAEEGFFRVGQDLRPLPGAQPDPRPELPAIGCETRGEGASRDFWAWHAVEVIRTDSCCGSIGGLFLCAAIDGPAPSAGTPGAYGLTIEPRLASPR